MRTGLVAALLGACGMTAAAAQEPPGQPEQLEPMQVTATRLDASVATVPASITIVRGDDLRALGASDLRAALAGVAGVEISMGGDNGPAGSVPAFWGLREFDAFLLVVDGVPAGGAFNPALTTLDLTNIERIEVMRGSAPVMYGATSFVGVIHVIHYAAGKSEQRAWASIGSHGSTRVGGSTALGNLGSWQQSVSASGELRQLADEDADVQRGHVLYRAGGALGAGQGRFDADLAVVHQSPDSPVVRQGAALTTQTPLDANHNPTDAKMDETRLQLNGGYRRHTGLGEWDTLVSVAVTKGEVLRGFLEDPNNANPNADGYEAEREIADVYLDSHFALPLADHLEMVWGADALIGVAKQEAEVFEYSVNLDGSNRPSSAQATKLKEGEGEGERTFFGAYAQFDWQALERLDLLAGLRWNFTHEMREGEREEDLNNNGVIDPNEEFQDKQKEGLSRLSGMVGASWRFWQAEEGHANLYADYRDSFKPAAFEFGPEVEAEIPKAENAKSYEAGIKTLIGERLETDVAWFYQDFENVFLLEGNDIRRTRLRGAELEATLRITDALRLFGTYAYHDARFVEAAIDTDGDRVADFDVSGNRFELAPQRLASFAFLYLPEQGVYYGANWSATGDRWLNKRNTAPAGAYRTVDATFGYRQGALSLALHGYNLTDRRDPVAESEFAEILSGASSYYRLPARHVELELGWSFGS
jgi:iron complex outermembrane recepter protein